MATDRTTPTYPHPAPAVWTPPSFSPELSALLTVEAEPVYPRVYVPGRSLILGVTADRQPECDGCGHDYRVYFAHTCCSYSAVRACDDHPTCNQCAEPIPVDGFRLRFDFARWDGGGRFTDWYGYCDRDCFERAAEATPDDDETFALGRLLLDEQRAGVRS